MDIETQQHQSKPPNIKKIVQHFSILLRALCWFIFAPHRRKFAKVWVTYKFGGIRLCWSRAVENFGISRRNLQYDASRNRLSRLQSEYILSRCHNKPLISILTPVYKVDKKWLDKCICSVINQHYTNWELILVDDASEKDDLKQLMAVYASQDKRVKEYHLKKNLGIAGATNFGIKQSKGEFIGFLDHDDELTPDALTWILWAINRHPDAYWFYSDEDKISENGECYDPYFKPNFSPELLLSNMFTCHFSVYSAKMLTKVEGLRAGFEGAQDHDLALWLSEIVPREKIIHIPCVLYHWRSTQDSAAMSIEAKPDAVSAGRKAVAEALKRRSLRGEVSSHKLYPWVYQISFQPSAFPKVSIIIPTRNSLPLIQRCIDSVRQHTNYPNYEFLIINNSPDGAEFLEYIKAKQSENNIRLVHYDKPFNHSEMNNIAVSLVDSEFVVLMNNDIEVVSNKWLEQLVAIAQSDESIGMVGGLLLYPDGKVQHGGMILGIVGIVGHAHKFVDSKMPGYFGRLHALQEMSGVTAALALVRRSAFEAVGGFNSERYPTSFNDVDFCIRLRKKGYRCLYNPTVKAIHYESKTRPITSEELNYRKRLVDDYSEILMNDPFYNPNLALDNEQFRGCRPFHLEDQIPELCHVKK
jgi:GT2 family glycosyltransferase